MLMFVDLAKQMLNERIRLEDAKRQIINDRAERIKEEAIDYVYKDQPNEIKQIQDDTTSPTHKTEEKKEGEKTKASNEIWGDLDFGDKSD